MQNNSWARLLAYVTCAWRIAKLTKNAAIRGGLI
jgi:hypothetical protein